MTEIGVSLLVAAIGAIITFVAQLLVRKYRERQLRRRFPVAGLFTTIYEDHVDGRVVREKGLTRLRQKGKEVRGVTSELQSGRCWQLDGRISDGGFLSGVYTAQDPHDTGSGTFFLEIEGASGDMNGVWAGYDSVNHSLGSGRYNFRRCPESKLRPAAISEAAKIVALLGDALGDRYIELPDVRRLIENGEHEACFVALSKTGELEGAVTVGTFEAGGLAQQLPTDQQGLLDELPVGQYHSRIGLLKAMAVAPHARERGLGAQLARSALDWMSERGATLALSIGWKSPQGCHIQGVLEGCGFEGLRELPRFWYLDSKTAGYSCPSCGDICECSAVIFSRSLVTLPKSPCRV